MAEYRISARSTDSETEHTQLKQRGGRGWRSYIEDSKVDQDILTDAPMLVWYALLTPPGHEFRAQKILRRHGLRTFVPVRNEWRRKNKFCKIKQLKSYAAMPRYVFTGFEPGIPLWFDLFSLPNVSGVVGLEGSPSRIKSDRMADFIRSTAHGLTAPKAQKFMRTHHEFTIGQTVEVLDGPFKDRKVPVVAIRGARAGLLLELFGAMHEIEVPMSMLQAA